MDFDIRAIRLYPPVVLDARVDPLSLLNREIQFCSGISLRIRFSSQPDQFSALPDPERLLCALNNWARVFRHGEDDGDHIHILAPAEADEQGMSFFRIDILQQRVKPRQLRIPVEVRSGKIMSDDDCVEWLVDMRRRWNPAQGLVLRRPTNIILRNDRLGWVGPDLVGQVLISRELEFIGAVQGANIVVVNAGDFARVARELRQKMPLESVFIWGAHRPWLTEGVVPLEVPRGFIYICNRGEQDIAEMLKDVVAWISLFGPEVELRREASNAGKMSSTSEFVLAVVLRGMISHSKIGQFSHCDKDTALTGVRSKRLNVSLASDLLNKNSELYRDKVSDKFIQWKEHGPEKLYFLNPSRIEDVKVLLRKHGWQT